MACDPCNSYTLRLRSYAETSWTFRIAQPGSKIYRQIQSVAQAAPCSLVATLHGLPDGWPFYIQNAKGMTSLNKAKRYVAKVLGVDDIEINNLNTASEPPYAGGGFVVYDEPMDISDLEFTARFFASSVDEQPLLTLSSPSGGIIKDSAQYRVTLTISKAQRDVLPESGVWLLNAAAPAEDEFSLIGESRFERE